MNDHFKSKNNAFADLDLQFQRASQDQGMNYQGIESALTSTLTNLTNDKQARRSVMAAMIKEQQ